MELEAELASEFHWSHATIMSLPIGHAFRMAMKAVAIRFRRLDDMRMAAASVHWSEKEQRSFVGRVTMMASGPGVPVRWEDQFTDKQKQLMQESDRKRDAIYEKLKAAGVLRGPHGEKPITALLKKPKPKKKKKA